MAQHNDFGTFGRFRETLVVSMPADMREAYEFTKALRGLIPGPHRIWLANLVWSKTIVLTGEYFQTRSTLTKPGIEIVTNLVTARWLSAYASYEHEKIGEVQGHLDPKTLQRLIGGLPVVFDDPREEVIYQVAHALVQPRPVSLGLYRKARERIGDAGLADVAVLIGWFTMVCMTLAVFDVPANADATGLDQ